ncbi:MAG: hypothetical protein R3E68_22265 [Burkholderiaceae bacterium]
MKTKIDSSDCQRFVPPADPDHFDRCADLVLTYRLVDLTMQSLDQPVGSLAQGLGIEAARLAGGPVDFMCEGQPRET